MSASPNVEVGLVEGSGGQEEHERNQICGRNTTTRNGEIDIGRRQESHRQVVLVISEKASGVRYFEHIQSVGIQVE